ncbi:MAG: WD40 repeat domain-containing protein [Spirochaetales bacterium]|nr:MAG: WD40 repeat domain-containing protein [Spirochaetales bacterium]
MDTAFYFFRPAVASGRLLKHSLRIFSTPCCQRKKYQAHPCETKYRIDPDTLFERGACMSGILQTALLTALAVSCLFASSCQGDGKAKPETNPPLAPECETLVPPAPAKNLAEWSDLRYGFGPVYSQAWSSNGELLFTADTGDIRVWEPLSGKQCSLLTGHEDFVIGLALSDADGTGHQVLASGSRDGSVRLWSTGTLELISTLHIEGLLCLAWEPRSRWLTVGTESGRLGVWDTENLKEILGENGDSAVLSLAWAPDGSSLACGTLAGHIRVFAINVARKSARAGATWNTSSGVNALAWSPDGARLASVGQDGRLTIWKPSDGSPSLVIQAHAGWARGLAWSPDGTYIATGGEDKRIRIWLAESGEEYAGQHHNNLPVWSVSWAPDNVYVASGGGGDGQPHVGATIVWKIP